jgi:hypothetical protein
MRQRGAIASRPYVIKKTSTGHQIMLVVRHRFHIAEDLKSGQSM